MIEIDGHSLTLEDLGRIALDGAEVVLAKRARTAVGRSRAFIEELLESGERIYGVTTGFGRLADVFIAPGEQRQLQKNLVRSHASGVGRPMTIPQVRALMTLRANALARGTSGCRTVVVDRLIQFLNLGIHPVVPTAGSVGASGDLAPLAHVALALTGEGRAITNDGVR